MDDRSAPLANVITLGTHNLGVLREFYRELGWRTVVDDGEYVAFELRGAVLALFPVDKLATDGCGQPEPGQGGIRFTVGIIASSPEEVDELAERVRRAGGRITKEPVDAEFFVGRSAYFADPEGNFWEIAWAPQDNPIVGAARRAARVDQ